MLAAPKPKNKLRSKLRREMSFCVSPAKRSLTVSLSVDDRMVPFVLRPVMDRRGACLTTNNDVGVTMLQTSATIK